MITRQYCKGIASTFRWATREATRRLKARDVGKPKGGGGGVAHVLYVIVSTPLTTAGQGESNHLRPLVELQL